MTKTFERALRSACQSQSYLISAGSEISIPALLEEAVTLRSKLAALHGSRVLLDGLPATQIIRWLLALDGMVDAILILPGCLNSSVRDELATRSECSHWVTSNDYGVFESRGKVPVGRRHIDGESKSTWLLATSGTTGTPKLVEHSFETLTKAVKSGQSTTMYRWGLMYDPNRFAGLQVVLQSLLGGASLVVPSRPDFSSRIQAMLDGGVNSLSATPTLWRRLLMDSRVDKLTLEQITIGGEIVDQALLDGLRRRFPQSRITHIYALTEVGSVFAVSDGRSGFPKEWLTKDTGPVILRLDSRGHLLIKTDTLPRVEHFAARVDVSGFFDTEDQVVVDRDRIMFLGRASGAINVGGNKVNPERVEEVLRQIPGIFDAHVYAKKSAVIGELVVADLVAVGAGCELPSRESIQTFCRKALPSWQVPVILRFVEAISISKADKLNRSNR